MRAEAPKKKLRFLRVPVEAHISTLAGSTLGSTLEMTAQTDNHCAPNCVAVAGFSVDARALVRLNSHLTLALGAGYLHAESEFDAFWRSQTTGSNVSYSLTHRLSLDGASLLAGARTQIPLVNDLNLTLQLGLGLFLGQVASTVSGEMADQSATEFIPIAKGTAASAVVLPLVIPALGFTKRFGPVEVGVNVGFVFSPFQGFELPDPKVGPRDPCQNLKFPSCEAGTWSLSKIAPNAQEFGQFSLVSPSLSCAFSY
jgi:hypothetical protein